MSADTGVCTHGVKSGFFCAACNWHAFGRRNDIPANVAVTIFLICFVMLAAALALIVMVPVGCEIVVSGLRDRWARRQARARFRRGVIELASRGRRLP